MTEQTPSQPAALSAAVSPAVPSATRPERARRWLSRLLLVLLAISLLLNISMYVAYQEYFSSTGEPLERFHSGHRTATDRIAVLKVSGTIMPPFTGRFLKAIEKAADDDRVKGVVLAIDSPGGLVADSHQIYHKLRELNAKKPVVVSMRRMAASGGYYVAMGAGLDGKIYAEPTAWTGSIGVIIPRYNARGLTEKLGIASDPLKTGDFKDALSPFRDLTDAEREIWREIMDDSFRRFLNVIAENRQGLDYEAVRKLATGQIYTAEQALANGMIDAIGFEEDAVEHLQKQLGLEKARVVNYQSRPNLMTLLIGSAEARQPESHWQTLMEATVPQAMYFCSWGLTAPAWSSP